MILLVGALIVAALTAFMARSLMSGSAAPTAAALPMTQAPTGPEILVATRSLPVGTILDQTALKYQPWPKELIDNAYYLKEKTDLKSLVGTVVRNPITAGQPLTNGSLVKPGDRGFLAAALGPGMRAITVPVQAQTGVAGFVFPGDRVDMVLTQEVSGGGDGPPLKAAETIIRNLRVLATDQNMQELKDENGNAVVRPASTVTVEVTPKIAEKIAVAQTVGSLSLSLRSIADNAGDLEAAIASGEVNVPDDPKAEKAMMTRIASAPIATGSTLATGADVSRFQRSTVPGKPRASAMSGGTGGPSGPTGAPVGSSDGPVVRVARGNAVTEVPVGGKN